MALNTHSKFYYGIKVTTENQYLDFNDGISDKVAKLNIGSYTPSQFASEVSSQVNKVASQGEFNFSFNRATKLFSIDPGANSITLLFLTGPNTSRSCASLLGFNSLDLAITSVTSASFVSILEYKTQFHIQSYMPTSQNRKAIDGVVNKSASGVVEVVKFGDERFLNGELLFITDIIQEQGSIVRTNTNGVSDYISLIEWLTEKYPVEIMIDEDKPLEFQTFILESTEKDSKGLDYELIETYDRGLPLFYRSGLLKFRLME